MTRPSRAERLVPYVELLLAKAKDHSCPVFALHHEGEWDGPEQLIAGGRYVDLRFCPSDLALREALVDGGSRERPLVLLTPIERLAEDVRARLTVRSLARPRADDALAHVFGVRAIDPRIESWLAAALVEVAPPKGFERTGARSLDLDRAWRALLRYGHGIDLDTGLEGMLAWADSEHGSRLGELDPDRRSAVVERICSVIPGAAPVIACARAGHGRYAVALGLIARALADAGDGPDRIEARTRLEPLLGGWEFDDSAARAWAGAAETVVAHLREEDELAAHRVLQQADRLVEELRSDALAAASDVLTSGLWSRLAALGLALDTGEGVDAAVRAVLRHEAASATGAVHVATMAERLSRWLALPEEEHDELSDAAADFAASGAYADLARTLLRRGGGEPTLDAALRRLVEAADERRGREEERFAGLLAAWSAHAETHSGLLGVEDVLRDFVAPLASDRPVLVVVLDGMSHRVAAELVEDATRSGWTELRRAQHPDRALVVAALPSATAFSRASLLSGELRRGLAGDETSAFAVHPELTLESDRHGPPVLFHKGKLAHPQGGLADDARTVIQSGRRVVGIVINAIDDHLARSEQVRSPWSVRDVLPLRWALDAAREAGRLVVLLSDHGHVLDRGGRQRSNDREGGERWRSAGRDPEDGEVLIEGPRVLVGGGRCVMASDERLRYSPKKHGYHGGATAQEVITPVVVLAPTLVDDLAGWIEAPYDPPAWWTGVDVTVATAAPLPVAPVEREPGDQLTLEPRAATSWISELLHSETLAAQRALAPRTPLPDERIAAILEALDARGGRMLRSALAQAAGIAPARLSGVLAALRLLLNVDGYDVLAIDSAADTVELNVPLLREQFELTG